MWAWLKSLWSKKKGAKQMTLFGKLKSGQRVTVQKGKEKFDVEWGPRGSSMTNLTTHTSEGSANRVMTEAECYTWVAMEEAQGLKEVEAKTTKAAAVPKNKKKKG